MTSTQMSIRFFPLACKRITCHGSNFICVEAREIKHNCFACLFSTDAFLLWKYRKKCLYKEEICSCRLMYNNHGNMCSNPIVFIKQHQQQQFFLHFVFVFSSKTILGWIKASHISILSFIFIKFVFRFSCKERRNWQLTGYREKNEWRMACK